ncbi:MAG: UDP-4-amino-4,6-dideoxy-N-acetyl-beta-L-altrosamine transaminase [Gammaproteobacteria bacterium]|nr:UDP-4-amino-4,6-dideoxy-N-acetyl-beta-L-altrosamine transaminase [Gammaproteobacteria bacterium]
MTNKSVGAQKIKIPYGKQSISADDISAVVNVLESNFLTQGPVTPEFEDQVAKYCQSDYAIATCNATAALHIACRSLDIKEKDIVWTSPNSFVASANCAIYCGATIDFVDIDPNDYNISIRALKNKLEFAKSRKQLPKAIIVVHFAGFSCDMESIYQLSQIYGFHIIEDASHAIGAEYQDSKVGSCQYSDMTIFSFHPVKIITSAEGGMVLTNQRSLYQKLLLLRNSGITKDPALMTKEPDGNWYYQQIELGYNYRLTDLHAALGLSQLKQLDHFIDLRRNIAEYYFKKLSHTEIQLPDIKVQAKSSWHLFVIRLNNLDIRNHVYNDLQLQGVGVQVHYIPIYQQPYYQQFNFNHTDYPNCEKYYQTCLSLPIYPELKQAQQDFVIDIITQSLAS